MGIIAQYLRVSKSELSLYHSKSILLEERVKNMESMDSQWLDIDKAWDGIIYLLTGNGIDLAKGDLLRVIVSTHYVDESLDFGYGPAHYIDSGEVQDLSDKIAGLDKAMLHDRFNPGHMMELGVYPDIWDEDEAFNYLYHFFCEIQAFFRKAAANNEAIVGMMRCEIDELSMKHDKKHTQTSNRIQQFLQKVKRGRIVENAVLSIIFIASSSTIWQMGSLFA